MKKEIKKGIICKLCGEVICKYELDWRACKGVQIQLGDTDKTADICYDCAKAIITETLEEYL